MQARRSLFSLLVSLLVHGVIIGLLFFGVQQKSDTTNSASGEISTAISMEMLQAIVQENPQPKPEVKQPEPDKVEIIDDPTLKSKPLKVKKLKEPKKPNKPIEKPKTEIPKNDRAIRSNAAINSKATTLSQATTTNPNLAGSGNNTSELAAYRSALRREIERHKHYPNRAKMMRKQGTVIIAFSIGADGSISGAHVVTSSGSSDLDNAAISAVNRAKSIGPRPTGMDAGVSVPINFNLQ